MIFKRAPSRTRSPLYLHPYTLKLIACPPVNVRDLLKVFVAVTSCSSSIVAPSSAASMASSRVSYLLLPIFATLLEDSGGVVVPPLSVPPPVPVSPPSVLPVPDVEESPLSVPPAFSLLPLFVLVSDVPVLSPPLALLAPVLEPLSCLPSFAPAPAGWPSVATGVSCFCPSPVASAVMGTRESTIDSVITRAKNFFFMGLLLFIRPFAFESPIVVGC